MEIPAILCLRLGRVHILVVLMLLYSTLARGREGEKEEEGGKEEERENMNENHA